MAILKKNIKTPRGFAWKDAIHSKGKTTIIFKKRGKLGKLLKLKKKVVVAHPKNSSLQRIENNKGSIGNIQFKFNVKKKR